MTAPEARTTGRPDWTAESSSLPEGIRDHPLSCTITTQEKALALSREVNVATPADTRWIMGDLVNYYGKAGRKEDAAKLSEERNALKKPAPPAGP